MSKSEFSNNSNDKTSETGLSRQELLSRVKRLVIKIGSNILTSVHSGLDMEAIERLVGDICKLRRQGYEVLLVSSGATLAGMQRLGLQERPQAIPLRQAAAAIGQSQLMWVYEQCFGRYEQKVAQVLLTQDDLSNRRRYLNAHNTLKTLLSYQVVPIINENDTVMVEELKLGDNDNLSALVAGLSEADLLIILSDIEGLCTADPFKNEDAQLIHVVPDINPEVESLAGESKDSTSLGGMVTKLQAAGKAASLGIPTIIACGRAENVLSLIMQAEEVGTLFLPRQCRLAARKHWIAYVLKPQGKLVVDEGAKQALLSKGKSLLPSGITAAEGNFGVGDAVSCLDLAGEEFARGLVNYQQHEVELIMGKRTSEIENILGYKYLDEVIHRDDLVLL